ncbi:MAG: phosphatidylserine decarboxylase [Polyangiaceae bacterium]|nr:phosphatidylserine decarboxylase [Polyangiaceae bacterium]
MLLRPTRLAAEVLRLLPRKRISRALGAAADVRGPRGVVDQAIETFVRIYGVDVSEAVVPPGGYKSFNDFFTRTLVPGARPIDADPRTIVSPADGVVDDLGPIDVASTMTVKGKLYDVADLLADPEAAARYEGGTFFVVYLSPRDYHRVHAPVDGPVERIRYVPGTLFPVNSIGTEHVPRLFARNERVSIVQKSARFGEVTTVMVGAIGVGRIGLSFDELQTNSGDSPGVREYGPRAPMRRKGEELGVFHLGSTAVVLIEPGHDLSLQIERGTSVRMGEQVARGGKA